MFCENFCFWSNCCCCSSDPAPDSAEVKSFGSGKGDSTQPVGRLLVFINPKSGAGRGLHTFRQSLEPKLRYSGLRFEIIVTEHAGHAAQVVSKLHDLGRFNAVLICSGDGLVFEVVNGILERADGFHLLRKLPIGIVPSGSGNGLLSSVFHERHLPLIHEPFLQTAMDVASSATAVSVPVGITHIQTPTQHLASFLSVGWGLLADIDIESEKLRRMCGSRRFFWGALRRVASLRTYRGRLAYLEAKPREQASQLDTQPVYNADDASSPVATEQPRALHRETRDDSAAQWKAEEAVDVPDIDAELPSSWKVIEEEFVFVYMVSRSHISNEGFYAPSAKLADPSRLYLTYALKKDVPSKAVLAKFLMSIETGEHLKFPFCRCVEVTAFRLESFDKRTSSGYIVVDGEVVSGSKVQASVTNLAMRVVCK